MWADVVYIDCMCRLVHPVPEAVAAGQVVLENASEAALELFRLARDAHKWLDLQHLFNTLFDCTADMRRQSGESLCRITVQNHLVRRHGEPPPRRCIREVFWVLVSGLQRAHR